MRQTARGDLKYTFSENHRNSVICSPSVEGGARKGTFLMSMVNSTVVNLSITIESNLFVGNKYRASDFLKKQRKKERKFSLDTLQ